MSKDRLVDHHSDMSMKDVPDLLYNFMVNVERALQMAGAKAGEDYTYKDLMGFAIEMYQIDAPDDRAFI